MNNDIKIIKLREACKKAYEHIITGGVEGLDINTYPVHNRDVQILSTLKHIIDETED